MEKSSFHIVRETSINIPESLQTLESGQTVSVPCGEFAVLSSVQSAACRLNQRSGWKEFEVSSPDNGATICMRRNEQPASSPVN